MSWLTNTLLGGITFEPVRKGLKSVTGMTDAQLGGAALAAASGGGLLAGAFNGAGLLSGAKTLGGALPAISSGLQIGNQVASIGQPQPMQPGQLQQRPGPDLSQFIAMEGQRNQMMDAERQKRLQQQQMAVGGLFGGANGRIA